MYAQTNSFDKSSDQFTLLLWIKQGARYVQGHIRNIHSVMS